MNVSTAINFINLLFLVCFMGPHLIVQRAYLWFCAYRSLFISSGDRLLTVYKANTLCAVLSLRPFLISLLKLLYLHPIQSYIICFVVIYFQTFYIFIFYLFSFGGFEEHPVMPGAYPWLCAMGSLLAGLRESQWFPGTGLGLALCQASVLPCCNIVSSLFTDILKFLIQPPLI